MRLHVVGPTGEWARKEAKAANWLLKADGEGSLTPLEAPSPLSPDPGCT